MLRYITKFFKPSVEMEKIKSQPAEPVVVSSEVFAAPAAEYEKKPQDQMKKVSFKLPEEKALQEEKSDPSIIKYFQLTEEINDHIPNVKMPFIYKGKKCIWMSDAPKTTEDLFQLAVAINFERIWFGETIKIVSKDPLPVAQSMTQLSLLDNKYYGNVVTDDGVQRVPLILNLLNDAGARGHKKARQWLQELTMTEETSFSLISAKKWLIEFNKMKSISLQHGSNTLLDPKKAKDLLKSDETDKEKMKKSSII